MFFHKLNKFATITSFIALIIAAIYGKLNLVILFVALLLAILFLQEEELISPESLGFTPIEKILKIGDNIEPGYVWQSMPRAVNFDMGYFIPPDNDIIARFDETLKNGLIPFVISPPNTGKTWLVLYYGYRKFRNKKYKVFYTDYITVLDAIANKKENFKNAYARGNRH